MAPYGHMGFVHWISNCHNNSVWVLQHGCWQVSLPDESLGPLEVAQLLLQLLQAGLERGAGGGLGTRALLMGMWWLQLQLQSCGPPCTPTRRACPRRRGCPAPAGTRGSPWPRGCSSRGGSQGGHWTVISHLISILQLGAARLNFPRLGSGRETSAEVPPLQSGCTQLYIQTTNKQDDR